MMLSTALYSLLLLSQSWAVAIPSLDQRPDRRGDALGHRAAAADEDYHWVATWTSMPQLVEQSNMPPSPFVSLGPGGRRMI